MPIWLSAVVLPVGKEQPSPLLCLGWTYSPATSSSACVPQGSTVLQSQGSQTTGLDVAAKSAVSKTLLLVLILSLWLVLASLPFPAWCVETGRTSYDGVQGCFLPLGQVLGCGVKIINLNLAIQTQPGLELKMPLGASRSSQFSGRGLVSRGQSAFLSSACWRLWAPACASRSDFKLVTQHTGKSGPPGPQSTKRGLDLSRDLGLSLQPLSLPRPRKLRASQAGRSPQRKAHFCLWKLINTDDSCSTVCSVISPEYSPRSLCCRQTGMGRPPGYTATSGGRTQQA